MSVRSPYLVLPHGDASALFVADEKRLIDLNPLPIPPLAVCAVDQESGLIAYLFTGGTAIGVAHADAEPTEQRFPPIPLPEGVVARALTFCRQVLYVGGRVARPRWEPSLGMVDFDETGPRWRPLPLPEELVKGQVHTKEIDDILIDGNRLLVVDNVVRPKWIVSYDVARRREPAVVGVTHLVTGPNFTIHFASLGASYLGVFGRSFATRFEVDVSHIILLDRNTLAEYSRLRDDYHYQRDSNWVHFAFVDDVLLIAAGEDGVGQVDVSRIDGLPNAPQERSRAFAERALAALRYRRVPSPAGARAVRVVPLPSLRMFVAVAQGDAGFELALLDVDDTNGHPERASEAR